jgi:hypothetical protein
VLKPEADASVNRSNSSKNYGTDKTLRVDLSPTNRAYLRFKLAGIDLQKVAKAELRVYVTESSDRGFRVRPVDSNSWSETKINYSNSPRVDDVVAKSSQAVAGKWITVNITSLIRGPGDGDNDDDDAGKGIVPKDKQSLALTGGSENGLSIASRESSSHAPQLIITFNP